MKTFGQVLVILIAALLVVGATVVFFSSSYGASLVAGPGGRGAPPAGVSAGAGQTDSGASVSRPQRPEGDRHEEGGGFSLLGLQEVGKNLSLIAVIVAVVAPTTSLASRWRRRGKLAARSPLV